MTIVPTTLMVIVAVRQEWLVATAVLVLMDTMDLGKILRQDAEVRLSIHALKRCRL